MPLRTPRTTKIAHGFYWKPCAILHLDGLTRVVVTHRLEAALLEQYDGIFVLRNGAVCEMGRFKDLMEQKEYFYSLYTVANG